MIFGATWACPACALRFTRRDACPSCGGAVVSLSDLRGRTAVEEGSRGAGMLGALGRWAPSRPWIATAVGVLMMLPALHALIFSPTSLLNLWWVGDHTEYDGLSRSGFQVLALGSAGLLLTAFSVVTWLGRRARPAGPPKKLRVHAGDSTDEKSDGRDEVTGIAKLATTEIQSLLGAEPCLAFGLRGEVDGVEVDDADGGDFDLVLPDGAVVMVSLEHARLEPQGNEEAIPLTPAEAADLEDFLLGRVGQRVREACSLQETVLAEGDTVTVIGAFQGKSIGAAPFREAGRSRVLGGTLEEPLIARVVKRAVSTE